MWTDVVELRNFYRSRIGGSARRVIRDHVRACWGEVTGMSVLGTGCAAYRRARPRVRAGRPRAVP